MLKEGTSKVRLRSLGAMLLHVVRTMDIHELRTIDPEEIERGALLWVADKEHNNRNGQPKSTELYIYVATKWLKFHGRLPDRRIRNEPDDTHVEQFVSYLLNVKGISPTSVNTRRLRVASYLRWNSSNHLVLESVTANDVDRYLLERLDAGYKPKSMASLCRDLRSFFHFAEHQKLNTTRIAVAIQSPRVPRYNSEPKGPRWQDVRRLLDHDFGSKPSDLRAAAVVCLSGIYGLRNSEVIRLKLSDFDWRNEILTIKRAKTGKIQQFPIQFEVGEKILAYLKHGRPKCPQRTLFVSLRPPYRVVHPSGFWVVVSNRMKKLGIESKTFGTHALRHACATHLLRDGSSLPEIAHFHGHSDLKSVSIYAKHDIEALKQIANFSLAGFL